MTGRHVRGHPEVNVLLAQSVSVIYFSSHTRMCTKKIEICSVLQEGLVSNMSASRRKQAGWQDTEWCGLTSSQEEVASSDHQLPTSDQLRHFKLFWNEVDISGLMHAKRNLSSSVPGLLCPQHVLF